MSAPTLWEEGRWSATRVTRLSLLAVFLLTVADLIVSGGLGLVFDSGFVLVCVGVALAVRPEEFFRVGVLPPVLLLGLCTLLAVVHRTSIAPQGDGVVTALISGLAHHSGSLLVGYALCLGVLAIRQRVLARHGVEADFLGEPSMLDQGGPPAYEVEVDHSNLEASPAPYRMTSGAPEERSTTVVGNEPDSPARTASNS